MYETGEAVARAFFDRWNEGDADGIAALFVEDADFVNVVGLWWHDRRAIRKAHDYGFRHIFENARVEITELSVRELTPDIHIVHTVSILDGQTGVGGTEAVQRTAVISMVTHRRSSAFQIVCCHNTDRVVGADTHVVDTRGFRVCTQLVLFVTLEL
ncbi:SgcJ/EcaC family oxidoreductase [Denitrobaculum tricleocarpae]|uniref:SgcJ/EcaC family oxidoreductase n=1 Tax=Denitrobaculum tricleocarpae TaxID=2591009 RepID=A0A545TQ89_9PROT|nr:SgcJ/EcaC family oxidoreductase [Denitrobaculum tricleocarpae]TQV79374.1 SgcJ/EcaC family oxidoreductase [Denitrobaculum tricleocarpae]